MPASTLSRAILKQLGAVVGREAVLTRPGELLPFECDGLTAYRKTPAAVVFVQDTEQLRKVIAALYASRTPFVPRGAGTGLSGGALGEGIVVIELSRMNRILWVDDENRRARVQPGVINSQLAAAAAAHGLMYAPDPSSQTACTLGGNVAENSGGPHCLKYGVTSNHVLAVQVVTPEGEVVELGGSGGYDLVGIFVGSEGTLGVCSEIEVRLVPQPAAVETLLAHFDAIDPAGKAVSAIIAAGILPAALEMIDRETLKAVEASVFAAGFPTDVAASLIVELDGPRAGLAEQAAEVEELLKSNGARAVARATSEADRVKFWKARKSAFGAMGRLGSDLLVQDATVPRSRLPEMLARVAEAARRHQLVITNVFHAGDGNLHPNIPFDRRDQEMTERVHAASQEIMEACVAVGGTITGEHGVGIDKRRYMPLIYSPDDLEAMRWVKEVFDPAGLCNPGKVLPDGLGAEEAEPSPPPQRRPSKDRRDMAEVIESEFGSECLVDDPEAFVIDDQPARVAAAPSSLQQLSELMKWANESGSAVVPVGQGNWLTAGRPLRRFDLVVTTRRLSHSVDHQPDDLLATVEAGVDLADLNARLAESGQWWPLDPPGSGSVGAAIASGACGPLATAYGSPRDLVLGLSVVRADGRIVKAGGRVVKNVAGYDLVKLFTGSWGTLGIVAEAHLRLHALPRADTSRLLLAERVKDLTAAAARLSGGDRLAPAALEVLSPEAAGVLGLGDDGWVMIVRWLGHERAVEDAVRSAEAERLEVRPATAELWEGVRAFEMRVEPALVLRADFPIRATTEATHLAVSLSGGATPMLIAAPTLGRLWIFVRERHEAASDERRWALRVEELRRALSKVGGGVRVERAPLALRRAVDPVGLSGPAARLQRGLKAKFDPSGLLKPGFLIPEF